MKTIQNVILNRLIHDRDYLVRVLPYLRTEYFAQKAEQVVFEAIKEHAEEYNNPANKATISVAINSRKDLTEQTFKESVELVDEIVEKPETPIDQKWALDETEKYVRDRAVELALFDALTILKGEDKKRNRDIIPDLLRNALGVHFDTRLGMDYFDDAEWRHGKYNEKHAKLPFKLDFLNRITHGGCHNKTLNIIAAGTNSFKSGGLCDFSAYWLSVGKNVLYLTLEMAEERIGERIDANLMKLRIQDVHSLSLNDYLARIANIQENTVGKLKVKEWPPGTVHSGHIRAFLKELELKENFKPDVLVVDYLNLMTSSRFKFQDLYTANKAISEELRGIGVEFDIPVWSATQFNRSGNENVDPSLQNIGESHGISATADFMIAFIITEELDEKNLLLVKQIKNRYNDKAVDRKGMFRLDKAMMTIHELEPGMPGTEILLNSRKTLIAEEAVTKVLKDTDPYGIAGMTKFSSMFSGHDFT